MNVKGYPRPSIMALSRQAVPNLPGTSKEGVSKGGYIIHGGDDKPDVILMGTGKPKVLQWGRCAPPIFYKWSVDRKATSLIS